MKWKGGRKSSNVEDRRATSGGGGGRGLPSMGTMMMLWPVVRPLLKTKFGWAIIGLGAAAYFVGFNPLSLIGMGGSTSKTTVANEAKDNEMSAFMSTTLGYTEEVWNTVLPKYGMKYREPKMVLYRGGTKSGCGFADSAMGPFYCPADYKVYLDQSFFEELAKNHSAPGDFAQAYVLAHEVGHHIQNLQGTLAKVQQAKQSWGGSSTKANALQVKVELQADCYAGVWAHHAHNRFGILEKGDLEEALRAAASIGDDTLQKKAGQYVNPDGFTHGSSAQRMAWLRRGLKTGDMRECNTFQ
ncbi:MAG: YpfJ protein, zinc metalloprotease superfamily [uncultured Sulfurovum sp.]|uniref:YpfJ protein, zinc metalloprotease superfamily n=1 Tax=uncultured Sulfurovum sp. TaxID=269237 RepID=A0A6S6TQZ9_9BACT|nr:MAG: YpfJ protein, zinc metalloprotease superfamily [uncultured Sulfurovum sp.]